MKDARPLDAKGTVVASTAVHEDRAGHLLPTPQVVVQVAFAGAVGTVFGRLDGADAPVAAGTRVALVKSAETGPENVRFRLLPPA